MFCSFDGSPEHRTPARDRSGRHRLRRRVRRAGRDRFTETRGARAVIVVDVERVSDSCGYGVPLMDYTGERDLLPRRTWSARAPTGCATTAG